MEGVTLPDWMLDAHGYRAAVPPEGWVFDESLDDFRKEMFTAGAAGITAEANRRLLDEVRRAYQGSDEMRALHGALDQSDICNRPVKSALGLHVQSSRKYTRFKFPNCPRLRVEVVRILEHHKCDTNVRAYMHDIHVEITIPRLGQVNEFTDYSP